ncbi:MAG: zinc ribbon domain-containing protein [Gammaproteobacteria bacterium]|jgi:putative FmdB family regulatory protein
MPIYEYQCKHCGCKFEALQKHNDQPLTKCPECGKDDLEKCVSLTSFQLKGKGWYETDFKSKKESEKTAKQPGSRGQQTGPRDDGGAGSLNSSGQQTGAQDGGESNKGNKTS